MSKEEKDPDSGISLKTRHDHKLQKPKMYKVIMLNDDYTTMEFVVWILQKVFSKSYEDSNRLMLQIHTEGSALCGIFTYDIAQTKVLLVKTHAEKNNHPLKCVLEAE